MPEPDPEDSGYCVVCGGYGVGTFAAVLNSHSDSIRNHRKCPGPSGREADRDAA